MLNADQVAQIADRQCTAPEISEFPGAVKACGVPVNVVMDMLLIRIPMSDYRGMDVLCTDAMAFGDVLPFPDSKDEVGG